MRRKEDVAAEHLPIRLIISISVMVAIAFLIAFGYQNSMVKIDEDHLNNQCLTLMTKLDLLVRGGTPRALGEPNAMSGTTRTFSFILPASLEFLALGVDPDPCDEGKLITGLTENGSVICYKIEGSTKQVLWFPDKDIKFREGNFAGSRWMIHSDGQGFILCYPGKTKLTFELVETNNQRYVLIHKNDNIEP
jgi:hypothetical protein